MGNWLIGIVGALLIILAQCIHFFGHPEWTGPQAMRNLWFLYIVGGSLIGSVLPSLRRDE